MYALANVLACVLLVGIWSGILATIVYFAMRRSPSRPRTLGWKVLRFCVIAPIAAYATFVCVALVSTFVLNRGDALAPGGVYICTQAHEKVGCVQASSSPLSSTSSPSQSSGSSPPSNSSSSSGNASSEQLTESQHYDAQGNRTGSTISRPKPEGGPLEDIQSQVQGSGQ